MKKALICLLMLACFCTVRAQKSNAPPVITRYMQFTGTIDKYPVTFQLYRINNDFSGCYYYNSSEQPIDFSGTMDSKHFLKLTASSNVGDDPAEVLEGVFKDSSFSGTWSYKGKMLPFRLVQKKDSTGLNFDYIWTTGSKKLKKGQDYDRDELSYESATVWPAANSTHPATAIIKQNIREAFGEKTSQEEIGRILINQKNGLLNQDKAEEGMTYSEGTTIHIQYRNPRLLSLWVNSYSDNGGVHGMHGLEYICIDLVHARRLAITDVLDTLTARNTLHTLLAKQFREIYHVKKDETIANYLFEEEIPLSDNFFISTKGISFTYNPYEIGAYALGVIDLFIPFKDIQACLKPEFKELLASGK